MERFAQYFATTLSGAINSSQTTFTVVSFTGAPLVPFRLKIDSEYILVTAYSGANVTACTRGIEGTAAAHSNGAVVEHVLTAGALNGVANPTLNSASGTSFGTTSTSLIKVTGSDLSFAAYTGQIIRVTAWVRGSSSVSGDVAAVYVGNASAAIWEVGFEALSGAGGNGYFVLTRSFILIAGSNAAFPLALYLARGSGTGTITLDAWSLDAV